MSFIAFLEVGGVFMATLQERSTLSIFMYVRVKNEIRNIDLLRLHKTLFQST